MNKQASSGKDMQGKNVVMPYFFIYEDEIVKLIETEKNVSIAMNLLGKRFPVATKHLQIMPNCKHEICTDLNKCCNQGRSSFECESYFCFDYKSIKLII